MKVWLLIILFSGQAAVAEVPNIGDYLQRFQDASRKYVGARMPQAIDNVSFRLGMPNRIAKRRKAPRFERYFLQGQGDAECNAYYEYLGPFCHKTIIAFDTLIWLQSDDLRREIIVFHELGHCVLGKDHEFSPISSIMDPMGPTEGDYLALRWHYQSDLFRDIRESLLRKMK